MKNVYDNYGLSKDTLKKEETAFQKLYEYNSRKIIMEGDTSLQMITNELIATSGDTAGHLLYVSQRLDECEYVLYKLKRIPILGFIIRRMESQL